MKYIKTFEYSQISSAINYGHFEKAYKLIDLKTDDINDKDKYGQTALHYAVEQGVLAMVEKLISVGADVNVQDNDGNTPLMNAMTHNQSGIAQVLIDAGADLDIYNDRHNTALHYATYETYDLVRMLIRAGADWNIKDEDGVDFIFYLSRNKLDKLKRDFPEKYQEYITRKEAEKYNL